MVVIGGYPSDGKFLLTPLREGRLPVQSRPTTGNDFYSRPCGRGDGQRRDAVVGKIDFYSVSYTHLTLPTIA